MKPTIKAIVFDAYGTLFDVHSVIALCEKLFPGQGAVFSQIWRAKQLEYTWLKSLMGTYEDFGRVTEAALKFACKTLNVPCNPDIQARLMEAYLHLALYPEVKQALDAFSGYPLAILSNGSPQMLQPVVKNSGLEANFTEVISVDEVKIFKPSPRVYELAPQKLGVNKTAIGFVSSNYWDVCGAKSFGFAAFWINRSNAVPDELGLRPDAVLQQITDLAVQLNS